MKKIALFLLLLAAPASAQNLSQTQWLFLQDILNPPRLLLPNGSSGASSYSFRSHPSSGLRLDPAGTGFLTVTGPFAAAGSNTNGGNTQFSCGASRGSGVSGDCTFYLFPAGASGSSINTGQVMLNMVGSDGHFTLGGLDYLGAPVTASQIYGTDRTAGSVTNGIGGRLFLGAGEGTGNAVVPSVEIQTGTAQASGTAAQTRATRLTVAEVGVEATVPITSTANNLGWSVQSAANQACTTTCTSAAVFGIDTAAGAALVGPTDATADVCLCAGAS